MLTWHECGPNCLEFILRLTQNPGKKLNHENEPTGDRTQARCVRSSCVTPTPKRWSFAKVKEPLREDRYINRDELSRALGRWIRNINKHRCADGVRRLPNIWEKKINKGDDYTKGTWMFVCLFVCLFVSNANPLHYYALGVPHRADRWRWVWSIFKSRTTGADHITSGTSICIVLL